MMASTNRLPALLLFVATAVGLYCLMGLGFTPNGLIPRMQDILHSSHPLWPGTAAPLKKTFTRIPFIDQMLYNLNPFFAHAIDGSNPSLSVYFLFFIGQYGAAIGLSWLESHRVGNRGRVISFVTIWYTITQNIGWAILFPVYLLVHVLTSPLAQQHTSTTSSLVIVPSNKLAAIPGALVLGYLAPSLLCYLPVSPSTRQDILSFWQVFPVWITLALTTISTIFSSPASSTVQAQPTRRYLTQLNRVYTFLLLLAGSTYLSSLLLTFSPSLIQPIFPRITRSLITQNVSFSSVFVPYLPLLSWRAKSLADGAHVFLLWDVYVSFTAALIWASTLLRAANISAAKVLPGAALAAAFAGPYGAILWLVWSRDVAVLEAGGAAKRK